MPKNVQITIQLDLFHMLARLYSKSFNLGFSSAWTENFQIYKLGLEKAEEPEIANIPWNMEKAREFQKSIYFCFIDYAEAFVLITTNWKILFLCGKFLKRDGNTRLPYLSPEKPVCRTRINSYNLIWNNRLVQNWERSTSRLYIITLLI